MIQEVKEDTFIDIDPRTLLPNPYQVRLSTSDPNFDELAESIRKSGLIEPPVICQTENGYQIATGHRRVAASIKLGLKMIRCILRQLSDEQKAEIPIEENLKRNSLNPIEEARGYANLRDKFQWSEETIAARFNKTRDIIAQRLRLLTFLEPIRDLVANGQLTPSHGEAIATAPVNRQLQLAQTVVDRKLSVKRTAQMAKEFADVESSNQNDEPANGPQVAEVRGPGERVETRVSALEHAIGNINNYAPKIICNLIENAKYANEAISPLYMHGAWKRDHCNYYGQDRCNIWGWNKKMEGVSMDEHEGRWLIRVAVHPEFCAACPVFKQRETAT